MSEEYLFTCKECGSHELRVVFSYRIIEEISEILPCECGEGRDGIAAERTYCIETDYEDYGTLVMIIELIFSITMRR